MKERKKEKKRERGGCESLFSVSRALALKKDKNIGIEKGNGETEKGTRVGRWVVIFELML